MKMNKKEIDFKIQDFTWTDSYKNAGEPTLYFEFNKSEYYALVAIKGGKGPFWKRAIQVYAETVKGVEEEVAIEVYPKQISKSEALLKFLLSPDNSNSVTSDIIADFEKIENALLLVDGDLI
jgi:hypothetical protein